jgi:hypothetical protein
MSLSVPISIYRTFSLTRKRINVVVTNYYLKKKNQENSESLTGCRISKYVKNKKTT